MTRPTPTRIVGPVEVSWQHLLYAVQQHAEKAPVGELAEHDAERLMQAARIIQTRLREEEGRA